MFSELGISSEDWERTPPAVQTIVLSLQQQLRLFQIRHTGYEQQLATLGEKVMQIDDLKAELTELRERVNQNSRNSSKPPSSDPPHQKPPPNAPSGRKQGAQPGHPGAGRSLKPIEEVDTVIELRPVSCRACGQTLEGDDPHPSRHQVAEVPVARAAVTEYRQHTLRCLVCGTANRAERPADKVPPSSFGARAQAIIGYLTGRLHASHRDTAEAMRVLHGFEVSVGSVAAIQQQVSEALAEPVRAARHFTSQQQSQHVDETGWRERGQRNWLWVNATRKVTV